MEAILDDEVKDFEDKTYICATCGTQFCNGKNGFCINDHDDWIDKNDSIEHFIRASVNLDMSIEEIINKIEDEK